jgi:hypothetical protein
MKKLNTVFDNNEMAEVNTLVSFNLLSLSERQ